MKRQCFYCERPFPPRLSVGEVSGLEYPEGSRRTIDHIIPKIKGGNNTPKNKIAACAQCNHLKSDMLPEQFAAYMLRHLKAEKYKRLGKQRMETMLKNTNALIAQIEPHREELFKTKAWADYYGTPVNVEELNFKISSGKASLEYDKSKILLAVSHLPPQNPQEIMSNDSKYRSKPNNAKILKDAEEEMKKKELKEVIDAFPKKDKDLLAPKTSEQLLHKLAKKYPYMYELLNDANPDFPRWIIDNLVRSNFSTTF